MLKNLANNPHQQIILASSSAYRKELLARLCLPFITISPEIDENPKAMESPDQTAMRLAQEKAEEIALQYPEAIIIGSDQVATLEGMQIGKPGNHVRALQQLQAMRGKTVIFHTALCVISKLPQTQNYATQLQNCQTIVRFRDLSDIELDAYLHIEKPYDCAGSAKNEGLGIALLESIENDDPTALTGLPLIALTTMLRNLGVKFFA
ncbi:Maf family nucleotide pyrophosphatase [Undibacterium flavidum]|uniref:7-methyl-GTP pyrophosphatase n=1 Tax=Undibacterium flavidum TaxID=2762297 RepID=A0ABR6YCK9_9BURK|nr:Maf family nucleotide pyrophosphatase [Undibacterium flavidum]MBC3874280.1 septum formation protein Maf [Undibacterium flavidum]